jgi:hypothetical protein
MGGAKKTTKKNFTKRHILEPILVLFYIGYTRSCYFLKRLHEHAGCEDLYVTFYFRFFKKIEVSQKYISNKGSICTEESKRLVQQLTIILNSTPSDRK